MCVPSLPICQIRYISNARPWQRTLFPLSFYYVARCRGKKTLTESTFGLPPPQTVFEFEDDSHTRRIQASQAEFAAPGRLVPCLVELRLGECAAPCQDLVACRFYSIRGLDATGPWKVSSYVCRGRIVELFICFYYLFFGTCDMLPRRIHNVIINLACLAGF